ncbi:MAG: GNAT family N-acetyltransferase [Anaerolineales bacterium]
MSSVTLPVRMEDHPHLRPLNVIRDLSTVADLIELCFAPTMDDEGQRYLSDMRRASRDDGFLRWANHLAETTSLPLTGYVWEQNGRIVGNASLIPFRDKGKRVYLVANVAVHPDHRGHGIGQALTRLSMQHAFNKKGRAVWLHVRDDNPAAIKLYANLGFQEIARRTTWQASPDAFSPKLTTDIEVVPRHANFWPAQRDWLRRLYPDALSWYHGWNFNALRPGLANWLYLLFVDYSIKQWAAVRGNELLATLAWMPHGGRSDSLFAAIDGRAGGDRTQYRDQGSEDETFQSQAITELLIHARRSLSSYSKLSLDFPAGEMTDAITAAGFKPRRTLIWMKAQRDE